MIFHKKKNWAEIIYICVDCVESHLMFSMGFSRVINLACIIGVF